MAYWPRVSVTESAPIHRSPRRDDAHLAEPAQIPATAGAAHCQRLHAQAAAARPCAGPAPVERGSGLVDGHAAVRRLRAVLGPGHPQELSGARRRLTVSRVAEV